MYVRLSVYIHRLQVHYFLVPLPLLLLADVVGSYAIASVVIRVKASTVSAGMTGYKFGEQNLFWNVFVFLF